ncbi:MAG: transposase family protein, partial [Bacteroidota bacterium]
MEIKNEALSSLVKSFEELPDNRRKQGQRHDQSVVLMIVLFSTMSGYLGYRAMGDFVKKHKAELVELLKVKKTRLPSFSTIR